MRIDVGCGNRPSGDINCDFKKYPFKCSITYWSPFKFFLFFPNEIQLKIFKGRINYDQNLVN